MATFERSVVIRAKPTPLFDLMQDYERRLEWDPFLRSAELIGATSAGLGVRAWCVDQRGRGMETEYVSFKRPRRVAVKMTRGPWIFKSFSGSWIYDKVDDQHTRVRFRYHVEARLPLPWSERLLEAIFSGEMQKRLLALKEAVEAGSVAA